MFKNIPDGIEALNLSEIAVQAETEIQREARRNFTPRFSF